MLAEWLEGLHGRLVSRVTFLIEVGARSLIFDQFVLHSQQVHMFDRLLVKLLMLNYLAFRPNRKVFFKF